MSRMCERGILSFQGKTGIISPDFPEKNDSFSVSALLFHPSLPKIWGSHSYQIYLFGVSCNEAIR